MCANVYFFMAGLVGLVLSVSPVVAPLARAQTATTQGAVGASIGKVMTVEGDATVEHVGATTVQASLGNGPVPARIGNLVYSGDIVQTGPNGKLGITLADGTAFNMSKNARMVLDEFVYDPNGKSNSSFISLTKGSFTFIAGAIAKSGNMKIDTPVATMGIRGTTPHIEIFEDGTVAFATLIEENASVTREPRNGPQDQGTRSPQRANRGSTGPSAEEAARYNKLFNLDMKICRGC
jgi:hypothetical protein